MTQKEKNNPANTPGLCIVRHADVCRKLKVSGAKLFDMIAKGQFPKPFTIIPGGRAVGWLARDVDAWILDRCASTQEAL
jgi:prophage regulatory protein